MNSQTRIYSLRGFATRMNVSLVIVLFSFVFGFFEIWRAATAETNDGLGYMFALFFLGGGIYGARLVLTGNTDTVYAVSVDEAGEGVLSLWRPFTTKRIVGPLDRLSDWRPYAKQVRRNIRTPMLLADHPDYPRPLEFEIGQGVVITDAFRTLVGEAASALDKRDPAPR